MTAKAERHDNAAHGYEVVGHALRPMDAGAYLAFAQIGIDQLARGEVVEEAEADRRIAAIVARLDPE